MSENVRIVQSIYEAFGKGDIPEILSHLSPDIEWEHDSVDHGIPYHTPGQGHDTVKTFFKNLSDNFDLTTFAPQQFLTGDNVVAVVIDIEGTGRESGAKVRDQEMHLWTFGEDGKATKFRHVVDTHQHWLAAGKP